MTIGSWYSWHNLLYGNTRKNNRTFTINFEFKQWNWWQTPGVFRVFPYKRYVMNIKNFKAIFTFPKLHKTRARRWSGKDCHFQHPKCFWYNEEHCNCTYLVALDSHVNIRKSLHNIYQWKWQGSSENTYKEFSARPHRS